MTVEALPTSSDDAALIAELTPQMLAKLKADSREQAYSTALLFVFLGAFVFPNLAKQFEGWFGVLLLLFVFPLNVLAFVTMARSYIGQPSQLRAELKYRRQHGKWRWER